MTAHLWSRRGPAVVALLLALGGLVAVWRFVDLSPQVEEDFFFDQDDPQVQAAREVSSRYGSAPQIIVRAEDLAGDPGAYRDRVAELTRALLAVEGITGGYSITTENAARSPMFSRILLTPDTAATNILIIADGTDPEVLLPRLEAVLAAHETDELGLVMSGVPVIVELIRRNLLQDLVVFSTAAVLLFALLIGAVYRDPAIVVGTLTTCFVSVSVTLVVIQAWGVAIGLLTANLITIVFVLTLSHVVFLTANWARAAHAELAAEGGAEAADGAGVGEDGGAGGVDPRDTRGASVSRGIRDTVEASFWAMTTTLLGFLSLLVASAKPLRELGTAGAVGTVVALLVAYAVYPFFLGGWADVRRVPLRGRGGQSARRARFPVLGVTAAAVALLGSGVLRLDTDPGLLTYFAPGGELREGLEQIDRDGGSSTLDILVRDAEGGRLDTPEVFAEMEAYQAALEADSAVGMVLSPTTLVGHARTMPLARFLTVEVLLDLASSPRLGGVGRAYIDEEREEGHYFLRMHEAIEEPSRRAVMQRLRDHAQEAGLEAVLISGLYDLQAQLGELIASSLRVGIGGLLGLFLLIAYVVSRSAATTGRMWLCLAGIPLVVLGTFGHFGIAVDIITSPAANIALAMGVDSMVHLVVRVRTLQATERPDAWTVALAQIRSPVLGATAIICAGFGIFALSTFPPTRRFGFAVILGTVTAAFMALVVLPRFAGRRKEATT